LRPAAELIGDDPGIRHIKERLVDLAPASIPVLISGETGTGKELAARALHDLSGREGPLVVVDCGALTPSLMEEELFGHERGAYTGAAGPRHGLLQEADKGTVLLDEIGELPTELQTRLLRAIDRGTVRRIGSNRHTPIDVRFISSTNRDLLSEVVKGNFRRDLFFRLAGFTLSMPSLRERKDDIPRLLQHFMSEKEARRLSPQALQSLVAYDWPGNVRELQLFTERARLLVKHPVIVESDVRRLLLTDRPLRASIVPTDSVRLEDVREAAIKKALATTRGNVAEAAELLGIGRSTVYAWLSTGRRRKDTQGVKG